MAFEDTLIVDHIKQTHNTGLLSEREKHLVGLAVTMTRGCQVCTRNRVEKARAIGLRDDEINALIAVTADHGVGFNPGWPRKESPTKGDTYLVPLFVKFPGQSEGEVIERETAIVDILPTIAEVIGLPIPWQVDPSGRQWERTRQAMAPRPSTSSSSPTRHENCLFEHPLPPQ